MVKVRLTIQDKGEVEIECEAFDLIQAVSIVNGTAKNDDGSKPAGFMVGQNRFFRSLEVKEIEIIEEENFEGGDLDGDRDTAE